MRTASSLAVLAVFALAGPAQAQLQYQFADATGAASASFSVPAGSTVSIRVYLRDTTAGAPTLSANGGLGSAAVRVSYTNPTAASIANVDTDVTAAMPPWDFADTNGSVANASAVLSDSAVTAGVAPTADRILLGTFTFTGNAEGTSTLTAADPNPGDNFDTTYFSNGTGLDSLISGGQTATITVTPVPEPAVLGVAAALAVAARRRRAAP